MACPHVSGAAALFLIADPSLSPKQLVKRMTEHATTDVVKHHGDGSPDKLLFVGAGDDEPPVNTPAPAPAPDGDTCKSLGWEVAEGDCTIDEDCCLTSPGYPEAYGASQNCVVKVGSDPGPIEEKHFKTEGWWDSLSFALPHDGVRHFSGGSGPHDEVPWGDLHWHADDSIQKSGFKLCLPHRGQCPENGWKPPSHCQATFTYGDTEYSGCTTKDHYGGWCQVSLQDGWLRWADCVQCKQMPNE